MKEKIAIGWSLIVQIAGIIFILDVVDICGSTLFTLVCGGVLLGSFICVIYIVTVRVFR